jgi:hypothetical protein
VTVTVTELCDVCGAKREYRYSAGETILKVNLRTVSMCDMCNDCEHKIEVKFADAPVSGIVLRA